jgi:hydroxymethylbilane synthase
VLEAGCTAPVGAYAEPVPSDVGRGLHIRAVVASRDGSLIIRKSAKGPIESAEELGRGLAAELLANGAEAVVDAGRPAS